MYKQYLSVFGPLMAAAALVLSPGMALAQHHGGGRGGGGHGGGHGGGGHGGGGHGGGAVHAGGHPGGSFHPGGGHAVGVHSGGAHVGAAHTGGAHFGGAHIGGTHTGNWHGRSYGGAWHGGSYAHHYGGSYYRGDYPYSYGYGGWSYPSYGVGIGLDLGYPLYSGYGSALYNPYPYYGGASYDSYPYYPDAANYDYSTPLSGDISSPPPIDYGTNEPPAPAQDNKTHIRVIVPADAKVWFDNAPTKQSGSVRMFESPPLRPGTQYGYTITAQWRAGDRDVTQTRNVDVTANSAITVDLTRPAAGQ